VWWYYLFQFYLCSLAHLHKKAWQVLGAMSQVRRGAAQVVRAGMFDNLSQGLEKAWDMVRRDGKLTAENIKAPMREIRRALLEADVRPLVLL
jgi:hypothetical protein